MLEHSTVAMAATCIFAKKPKLDVDWKAKVTNLQNDFCIEKRESLLCEGANLIYTLFKEKVYVTSKIHQTGIWAYAYIGQAEERVWHPSMCYVSGICSLHGSSPVNDESACIRIMITATCCMLSRNDKIVFRTYGKMITLLMSNSNHFYCFCCHEVSALIKKKIVLECHLKKNSVLIKPRVLL